MPVLFRPESDVFREAPFVDVMVNPVNCVGTMGAGLALEFSQRHPGMIPEYRKLCNNGTMAPGYIQIYKEEKCNYTVVNLPTKVDYRDDSDPELIRKGLMALRHWLMDKSRKKYTVTMPMLGCGLGNLEYDTVIPIFKECLSDLPNVISVTMRPKSFTTLPKFLVLFGSRGFANPYQDKEKTPNPFYRDQLAYMEQSVRRALSEWGLGIDAFTAVMSGGAAGTDTAACGASMGHPSQKTSVMHAIIGDRAIPQVVALADWERFGNTAGIIRNEFMADVGTHFIGFKPAGVKSTGTDHMRRTLEMVNKKLAERYDDPTKIRFYKRIRMFEDFGSDSATPTFVM